MTLITVVPEGLFNGKPYAALSTADGGLQHTPEDCAVPCAPALSPDWMGLLAPRLLFFLFPVTANVLVTDV